MNRTMTGLYEILKFGKLLPECGGLRPRWKSSLNSDQAAKFVR